MSASLTTFSTINMAASAGGAILAGVAAWAMMEAGVVPWKTRAALLTLVGLVLPLAGFAGIYARDWMVVAVSALMMGAFQAWLTLLYAGVADSLPSRGVAIGAAIGAFMMGLVMMLFNPVMARLMSEYGTGFAFGLSAILAAAGLLSIGLMAWLVHPDPELLPRLPKLKCKCNPV